MSILVQHILIAIITYLIGSVSFSELFSRLIKKKDITKLGSGNAGTTNMLRTFGWKLGILTLICDLVKGCLAVYIGFLLGGELGEYVACVFVVTGHNYSVFMKFKGGKGIATTTGVLLVIMPIPTIIIFAVCVVIVIITKVMSIGSIIGIIASLVTVLFLFTYNYPLIIAVSIICFLVLFAHRANIIRLLHGKENKLSLHNKKN